VSAEQESAVLAQLHLDLFIGGEWRPAAGGRTFSVDDPATGRQLCQVADADAVDARNALASAVAAQADWAAHPPRERSDILRRASDVLLARVDDLSLLMTLEMGKPLAESRAEIAYAAEFLRWFSEEAVRIAGRYAVAPNGRGRILVMRQPVGPCLFVTPWNFPMAMAARKLGPALAAGCTCVIKPAEQTPLCTLALADILAQCGLPAGVVNVLTTSRPGPLMDPLIRSGLARKISFTGSTEVGKELAAAATERLLRISLELGGNAPFLVFSDADLEAAVEGAVIAKMRNVGEACTAANRFLVHSSVADEFGRRLAERMSAMTVGRGTEDGVEVGPLIDEAARSKVQDLVSDAVSGGAKTLAGGSALDGPGYFYPPTVLMGTPPTARLLREEIFGPVAAIATFESEKEAVARANLTQFGLVAYVYTQELSRALRVVEALEVGMVGLNQGLVSNAAAPFGGIKESGYGREGGPEGMDAYLETKYVAIAP